MTTQPHRLIPEVPSPAAILQIPPPPPAPKRDLRRALAIIGRIREEPSLALELGMEMMDALGGYYDGDKPFQMLIAHPEGRRMLQERPCLASAAADRAALARLPEGSFGRVYLDFCERAGISADSLIEMKENRSQAPSQDPLRSWFDDRLAVSHDLQHVLTGYGTDSIGENALLLFTRGQNLAGPGLRTYTTLTVLGSTWRVRRFIWDAYMWGRRVPSLVAAPYEHLLPMPLSQVRNRLGLGKPEDAHPFGILQLEGDEVVTVSADA